MDFLETELGRTCMAMAQRANEIAFEKSGGMVLPWSDLPNGHRMRLAIKALESYALLKAQCEIPWPS